MDAVVKTLLACVLGIGFIILDTHAKPTVAFLGLTENSDPLIRESLGNQIQYELTADTNLFVFSKEAVARVFSQGLIAQPEISAMDLPRLSEGLGAQYFSFGKLESLGFTTKRARWKPWSVRVRWNQNLRLRILETTTGKSVFDGLIVGQLSDTAFLMGPDPWSEMTSLEKDVYLKRMVSVLSQEAAQILGRTIKEKTAPPGTANSTAGTPPAK